MLSSLENKGQSAQSNKAHFIILESKKLELAEMNTAVIEAQIYAETWAIPVTDYPAALVASVFCVMQKQLSRIIGTQFDLLSPRFLQCLLLWILCLFSHHILRPYFLAFFTNILYAT